MDRLGLLENTVRMLIGQNAMLHYRLTFDEAKDHSAAKFMAMTVVMQGFAAIHGLNADTLPSEMIKEAEAWIDKQVYDFYSFRGEADA